MPLRYTDDPASLESLNDVPEEYVIFYSSRAENGRMWCPDCRDAEGVVDEAFAGKPESPSGLVVYVGQKAEWKSPSNPFKAAPWNIRVIPTIVRQKDNARLEESEILQKIDTFTSQ